VVVRIEAYNVTNEVLYGFPNTDFANVNFGRITAGAAAYSPRTFQAAVRYIF
jgi:hypothetical protein